MLSVSCLCGKDLNGIYIKRDFGKQISNDTEQNGILEKYIERHRCERHFEKIHWTAHIRTGFYKNTLNGTDPNGILKKYIERHRSQRHFEKKYIERLKHERQ